MTTSRRSRLWITFGAFTWAAGVCAGFVPLWRYSYTPGLQAAAPPTWPAESLARRKDRATVLMILHPQCSCSQASLEELSRVMARVAEPPSTILLFDVPAGGLFDQSNALWRAATAIPGVTALVDRGGVEAERFGANVSGQTFLYDAAGVLRFSGGITGARGHAGDNDGAAALLSLLNTHESPIDTASVFGCGLARGKKS